MVSSPDLSVCYLIPSVINSTCLLSSGHGPCANPVELLKAVAKIVQDMAVQSGKDDFSLIALTDATEESE